MAVVPFCLGFLSEPRIARMGYDANPALFVPLPHRLGHFPIVSYVVGRGKGFASEPRIARIALMCLLG